VLDLHLVVQFSLEIKNIVLRIVMVIHVYMLLEFAMIMLIVVMLQPQH
jgi:hypothetical protein